MQYSKEECRVCGKSFSSERALHAHIKSHDLFLADYYVKYFKRKNLLTGELLPFKNKSQYFSEDFSSRNQLMEWCEKAKSSEVKEYISKKLEYRINAKNLKVGPCHLELSLHMMPDIEIFQKHFGSYTNACNQHAVQPMFASRLPGSWQDESKDVKIFIDTREQHPLEFCNSESMKLDVGDYVTSGENYAYTYVDRKGEQDFKSTLSKNNLERFQAELQRTKDMGAYLFIVTESSVEDMEKNNRRAHHKSNMKYIYHNMRVLSHKFSGCCQFIFSGNRENSEKIIPKILTLGKDLWDVDLQYYIDRGLLL